jgi:hypothetical protein
MRTNDSLAQGEWGHRSKKVHKIGAALAIDTGKNGAILFVPQIATSMTETQIIRAEIPEIARIVQNECWLESERRGCKVDPHDEVVRRRVAEIILGGAGAYLREKCCNANIE